MKANATTIFIWLFLVFVAGSSLKLYFEANSRANRMEANLKAANEQPDTLTTRDGHRAVKATAQELTASELKAVQPGVAEKLRNLYIPPQRAETYTELSAQMKVEVTGTVRDSVIIPARTDSNHFTVLFNRADSAFTADTIKLKVLEYRDQWISIHAVQDPDSGKIKVLANDSIFTSIYRGERRHRWAWIFSKRKYQVAATNRSPYVRINVIHSGIIKK